MKRYTFVGMAALLGLTLMTAPASANQKGVNACTKTLMDNITKTVKAVQANYNKCTEAVEGCQTKATPAKVATCVTGLTAAGKKCSAGALNVSDPSSKAGKPVAGFISKFSAKCDPLVAVGKITASELFDSDPNHVYAKVGLGAVAAGPAGWITNICLKIPRLSWARLSCLPWLAGLHTVTTATAAITDYIIWKALDEGPHQWPALQDTGGIGQAYTQDAPIGNHLVTADVTARLNTAVFPADITGIIGSFEFDVSGVDPNGIATIDVPGSSSSFTPVAIPAFGLEVCVKQPVDGDGVICCDPAGCPGLGSRDYTANQDHDSSGLNTAFGFVAGAVDPLPDSGCTHVFSSSIAGLTPQVTLPCSEKQARPGACNATALGEANPNSAAPRCAGGPRNGKFCDPGSPLASECPAGGVSCASRSPAFPGASLASPCNSAARLVPGGSGFGNGDLVLNTSIQFTLHEVTIDNIINATGAAGMDAIPDGFGADGLPCTSDDTTPPNNAAQIALTTGAASSTVFNANMVPSGACPANPGEIKSSDAGSPPPAPCAGTPSVGVTPANACRNLSISVSTGYDLAATFPALGGSTTGDTATAVHEQFQ